MVQPWIKSVTNHIYWTAASTPNGDEEIMASKWKSLTNHLLDIHSGHDGPYTTCEHGPLVGDQRNKQWFKPGEYKACCISKPTWLQY